MDPPRVESRQLSLLAEFHRKHRVGLMTLVFTDMVDSTRLKMELGDAQAGAIIERHHSLVRQVLSLCPAAQEISTAGDSFFIAVNNPSDAVQFALQLLAALRQLSRQVGRPVQDRIGIHAGEVFVEVADETGRPKDLTGVQVDTCARVMALCDANRILLTRFTFDNARQILKGRPIDGVGPLQWVSHGLFQLKGLADPLEICEVAEADKTVIEPLADSEKAHRFEAEEASAPEVVAEDDFGAGRTVLAAWARRIRRQAWVGAVGSVVAMAATLLVLAMPLGRRLAELSFDLSYWFRTPVVPEEAIIVYMDDASHTALGQPFFQPWDRSLHARLIERLAAAHARAIVFDVLFESSRTNDLEGSMRLVNAARRHGNVFVAATATAPDHGGIKVNPPFEELSSSGKWGLVEKAEGDLTVRTHHRRRNELPVPTLAECVASSMVGWTAPQPDRLRWMNYYGPPGTLPHRSYADVLEPALVADKVISNKVVFVGVLPGLGFTGGRGKSDYARVVDDFQTPYTRFTERRAPGVEINATAFLNLVRDDWLRQLSPGQELSLLLAMGMAIAVLLGLMPPLWAAVIGSVFALTLPIVASLLVWRTHFWFTWPVVSVVQVPACLLWSVVAHSVRLQREKQTLERALVTRRTMARPKVSPPAG